MSRRLHRTVADFSGARATLISDGGGQRVAEHAHDWPVLSLFVMGGYRNQSELGETCVASPSAMFYSPGERHSNEVGPHGLEQVDLEFDPRWLKLMPTASRTPVRCWHGGAAAAASRRLLHLWRSGSATEEHLSAATKHFLLSAFSADPVRRPNWLSDVLDRLDPLTREPTSAIARELRLNPGWLAEAYRAATGEGIAETVRRRRVELAVHELRTTDEAQAEVAAAAGFCDQSHMIRSFRAVLGRTPQQVRREWLAVGRA